MATHLTNIHIHVFNSECAPENFLRIMSIKFVRKHPKTVKTILEQKNIRKLIWKLNTLLKRKKSKRRSSFAKYIAFLNVGTQRSQSDVYNLAFKVAKTYDPSARIVGLTLDMDHMDNQGKIPEKPLKTQLEEVKQLKRYNPDNFFPFLGVDPRARSGSDLVTWASKFFSTGIKSQRSGKVYPYFSGIKIYPALGYFPFDPRLDELYAYAQKEGIPIMTHCTRGGSQYVGTQIESLIPLKPSMIMPNKNDQRAIKAQKEIFKGIKKYYDKGWIKNSNIGNNDKACDLFSHPQNYVPVMVKYPNLRICLAHMGGTDEVINEGDKTQKEIHEMDHYNFADLIFKLMKEHPNMFTDMSYTLSGLEDKRVRIRLSHWLSLTDKNGKGLEDRVLFGTDFFMTEQEAREYELYELARSYLGNKFDKLARENAVRYLGF